MGGAEHELNHASVFVVGSQRSGTTWLQCLLGAHPSVAAPQEPEFFTVYVTAWHRAWSHELRAMADEQSSSRLKGVSSVMTQDQFDAMVRRTVETFHDAVLALKPTATVVLEKCPEYHRSIDVIRTYVPDARFVHLVRDGRDVASSLVAASRGWGRGWAPTDVAGAASMWARAVRNARAAGDHAPYLELRYEDMLADGPTVLEKTLAFCGVDATRPEVEAICAQFEFDALRDDPSRPYRSLAVGGELTATLGSELVFPEGFFRAGTQGGWREAWSAHERAAFDRHAGDLLVDLGYERDHSWATGGRRPSLRERLDAARITALSAAGRVRRATSAARRELRNAR